MVTSFTSWTSQDGGDKDWSLREPPKTNRGYYLRICKSSDRMGGTMPCVQGDDVIFLTKLLAQLPAAAFAGLNGWQ